MNYFIISRIILVILLILAIVTVRDIQYNMREDAKVKCKMLDMELMSIEYGFIFTETKILCFDAKTKSIKELF